MSNSTTPFDQIATLPLDELITLRGRIDALIQQKLSREKQQLLKKLAVIEGYEAAATSKQSHLAKPRSKPTPKYRDPKTGRTWTGRGMKPRWMIEAVRAGAREEDFLIKTE